MCGVRGSVPLPRSGRLLLLVGMGLLVAVPPQQAHASQDDKRKDRPLTFKQMDPGNEETFYKLGVWISNYFFGTHAGQELGSSFGQKDKSGNPSPDSPSSGERDLDMLIQLMKQHGGPAKVVEVLEGTPLGKRMIQSGKGKVPVWNPADFHARESEYIGAIGGTGGGFDPNAGSPASQLKRNAAKSGTPAGGGGDKGAENRRRQHLGLYTDDMPGPPAIVNPAWRRLIATAVGMTASRREEAILRLGLGRGMQAATQTPATR